MERNTRVGKQKKKIRATGGVRNYNIRTGKHRCRDAIEPQPDRSNSGDASRALYISCLPSPIKSSTGAFAPRNPTDAFGLMGQSEGWKQPRSALWSAEPTEAKRRVGRIGKAIESGIMVGLCTNQWGFELFVQEDH